MAMDGEGERGGGRNEDLTMSTSKNKGHIVTVFLVAVSYRPPHLAQF